jgi:hypothetical protein
MSDQLDSNTIRTILEKYKVAGADPAGDGVYVMKWVSTETLYRFSEEYVAPEKRLAYKLELERVFPHRKGAM